MKLSFSQLDLAFLFARAESEGKEGREFSFLIAWWSGSWTLDWTWHVNFSLPHEETVWWWVRSGFVSKCPQYTLELLQQQVVLAPYSDAAAQDAFCHSSVKGAHSGSRDSGWCQFVEEVETLLTSTDHWCGISRPGDVFCDVHTDLVLATRSTVAPFMYSSFYLFILAVFCRLSTLPFASLNLMKPRR